MIARHSADHDPTTSSTAAYDRLPKISTPTIFGSMYAPCSRALHHTREHHPPPVARVHGRLYPLVCHVSRGRTSYILASSQTPSSRRCARARHPEWLSSTMPSGNHVFGIPDEMRVRCRWPIILKQSGAATPEEYANGLTSASLSRTRKSIRFHHGGFRVVSQEDTQTVMREPYWRNGNTHLN